MTNKIKAMLSLMLSVYIFNSCSKENDHHTACNVADPINQLSWLNNMVKDDAEATLYAGTKIYSYSYNGNHVIYVYNPASSLGSASRNVYDCNGTIILANAASEDQWTAFDNGKSDEVLIWQKN